MSLSCVFVHIEFFVCHVITSDVLFMLQVCDAAGVNTTFRESFSAILWLQMKLHQCVECGGAPVLCLDTEVVMVLKR